MCAHRTNCITHSNGSRRNVIEVNDLLAYLVNHVTYSETKINDNSAIRINLHVIDCDVSRVVELLNTSQCH